MQIVIKSLGIIFALLGTAYLLRPDIIKRLMVFFKKGKRIYFAGILRFALAVVFFAGARECRYPWIIFLFGTAFLLSGLLIFILGAEWFRRMFDWYHDQSYLLFELIAFVVAIVGVIIIYSA